MIIWAWRLATGAARNARGLSIEAGEGRLPFSTPSGCVIAALRRALRIAANDTEAVPHRVFEHHPARPVGPTTVCDLSRAQTKGALDLLVPGRIRWGEVDVYPADRILEVGDLNEEQTVSRSRVHDHALLIARLVRVTGDVGAIEDALPPLRDLEYVEAVDRGLRDTRRDGQTPVVRSG